MEYALRLKKEMGVERTWVSSYANEVPAYLPSEKVLKEGGYEAGWDTKVGKGISAWQMTRWPTPFAEGVEDRVVEAVRALAEE